MRDCGYIAEELMEGHSREHGPQDVEHLPSDASNPRISIGDSSLSEAELDPLARVDPKSK